MQQKLKVQLSTVPTLSAHGAPGNDLMNFLVVITAQDRHSKRIELSCRQYHVL